MLLVFLGHISHELMIDGRYFITHGWNVKCKKGFLKDVISN